MAASPTINTMLTFAFIEPDSMVPPVSICHETHPKTISHTPSNGSWLQRRFRKTASVASTTSVKSYEDVTMENALNKELVQMLSSQLANLEEKARELTDENESLKSKLLAQAAERDEGIKNETERATAISSCIKTLETQLEDAMSKFDVLAEDLEFEQQTNGDLQEQIVAYRDKFSQKDAEVVDLNVRLSDAKKTTEDLQRQLDSCAAFYSKKDMDFMKAMARLGSAETLNENLQHKLAAYVDKFAEKDVECQEAKVLLESAEKELAGYQSQITSHERTLKEQISQKQCEVCESKVEVSESMSDTTTPSSSISDSDSDSDRESLRLDFEIQLAIRTAELEQEFGERNAVMEAQIREQNALFDKINHDQVTELRSQLEAATSKLQSKEMEVAQLKAGKKELWLRNAELLLKVGEEKQWTPRRPLMLI
ncbi:hypothetical protein P154DRAFT_578596 [Amniculicola lignicola CBS 123094]|uniref:Uncharacterized protein n=1 Tax=Amniculicola lignicola CBS 123094 TaxID=1392246 RepID=A0A6A5W968_9PLEO|nr:hypothetical protein P154DRAFT_578596 [Amniculicola lignicola CBS 123094]